MSVNQTENKRKGIHQIGYCLKYLMTFLSPYKGGLILGLLMVVVANITFAVMPLVEGQMTTQLFSDGEAILKGVEGAHVHFDVIFGIMGTLVVIYIIKTVSQLITAVFLTKVLQQAMCDIRNTLQKKIQRLPVRYFDNHAFGDVLSCVTNDVDTLSNALQETLQRVLAAILTFIFVIGMMFYINIVLACIALLIIPLSLIVTRFFVTRSQKLFDTQQQTLGELNGTITEMYGGFNEIILYNRQQTAVDKFHDVNGRMRNASFKAQFASSLISPCISLITYLIIGSVAVTGCLFVMNGTLLLGNLQAFIRYIWQINDPLSQISQLSSQVQSAFAAMGRIFTLLDEEEEAQEGTVSIQPEEIRGEVTFDHVVFGYDDETLMRDVNFEAKTGQMVAIVGPTGAGKTTLLQILMGFSNLSGGRCTINAKHCWKQSTGIKNFTGYLPQKITLPESMTSLQFFRFLADLRNRKSLEKAIRTADAFELDTSKKIRDLNQEEKKKLAIAGVFLHDPEVLLLDEPAAGMNPNETEELMDMIKFVRDHFHMTILLIEHDMKLVSGICEQLTVLNFGEVLAQGDTSDVLNNPQVIKAYLGE